MSKTKLIENMITKAAVDWGKAISHFYPAVGYNGFNERNLTTYISAEILNRGGFTYNEVPLQNKRTRRFDLRVDTFATFPNCGIFIEAKRLYNLNKLKELLTDYERLSQSNLQHYTGANSDHWFNKRPKSFFKVIIAEVWENKTLDKSLSIEHWWRTRKGGPSRAWQGITPPKGSKLSAIEIKTSWDLDYKLFWCWAISELQTD